MVTSPLTSLFPSPVGDRISEELRLHCTCTLICTSKYALKSRVKIGTPNKCEYARHEHIGHSSADQLVIYKDVRHYSYMYVNYFFTLII